MKFYKKFTNKLFIHEFNSKMNFFHENYKLNFICNLKNWIIIHEWNFICLLRNIFLNWTLVLRISAAIGRELNHSKFTTIKQASAVKSFKNLHALTDCHTTLH